MTMKYEIIDVFIKREPFRFLRDSVTCDWASSRWIQIKESKLTMRILVVMDPIANAGADEDTSIGFMLAAQRRGHQVEYCQLKDLYIRNGAGYAVSRAVRLNLSASPFYQLGEPIHSFLSEFDTIWMRKDPPVDDAYLHGTHIFDLAGPDVLVVNSPEGLRYANEKLYAQQFPQFCPETLVTRDMDGIRRWLDTRSDPLIVKPVDGHGGRGIFRLDKNDRNIGSILETLSEDGRLWVVAQSYLPEARKGDKRIILIDGEPQGAILRIPQSDDNRGNMHVGGRVEHCELTERDLEICGALAPRLKADGLWFVGLDVIGGYLTEINVTSPTGIREIEALSGRDVAGAFVEWVEVHRHNSME